jgi:DNA-binding NtrC family response regulator
MSDEVKQSPPAGDDPPTIMLVEQDILVRMLLAEYLRGGGYKVIEGVSVEDVLAVLRAGNKVQIIFVELRTGGDIDGFGLASQVRGSYPDIDVILTSGVENAASKASDLCDQGPSKKPYHAQELLRRINRLRENRGNSSQ